MMQGSARSADWLCEHLVSCGAGGWVWVQPPRPITRRIKHTGTAAPSLQAAGIQALLAAYAAEAKPRPA